MSDAPNEPALTELELAILRALVSQIQVKRQRSDSTEIRAALERLAGHAWQDEEHRVVYECMCAAINRSQNVSLREEMAAEATRKGHPDVDWNLYFTPPHADADITKMVASLTTHRRD
jgi:hypothetical protein